MSFHNKEYSIPIHIGRKRVHVHELIWDTDEREIVAERILSLKDVYIGALVKICVGFNDDDIPLVVSDIQKNGHASVDLSIVFEESESKEQILWWVNYFEGT